MARIIADFKSDWHEQLLEQMRSVWGDQVDGINRDDVPFRFFDSLRRDIPAKPRLLKISDNFVCATDYDAGWSNLRRKVETGESLKPHQSKDHLSFRNQDGLLDDWGVHHFHLGIGPHPKIPDLVERTPPVVFALVTDEVFYAINTYEHQGWARTEIVETLHRNWPDTVRQYVLHGVSPDPMTESERTTLRKKRANCVVTVEDGTVYGPLGGPVSASGMTIEAVIRTAVCHDQIARFQRAVEESFEQIVSQLGRLGHTVAGDLRAKYVILDGEMAVGLPDQGLTLRIAFDSLDHELLSGWEKFVLCVKKRCSDPRLGPKQRCLLTMNHKSRRRMGQNFLGTRFKKQKPSENYH